jgi:CBS domain-containing protein
VLVRRHADERSAGASHGRLIMYKTVAHLLQTKGTAVLSVPPDSPVFAALELMADKNVGALLVVEGERLVGVLSERDYARKVILKGKSSKEIPVREIMSTHVLYVRPQHTIEECMALMTDKRVRHLPVLEEERIVGIVSIGDVVKAIITEQEFMIEQLQSYITGR